MGWASARPRASTAWAMPVLFSLSLLLGGASLPSQETIAGRSVVELAQTLKPGEFVWVPQVAPEGPLLMIVSTAAQRGILYRNGVPVAVTTVSTGREGYPTRQACSRSCRNMFATSPASTTTRRCPTCSA